MYNIYMDVKVYNNDFICTEDQVRKEVRELRQDHMLFQTKFLINTVYRVSAGVSVSYHSPMGAF